MDEARPKAHSKNRRRKLEKGVRVGLGLFTGEGCYVWNYGTPLLPKVEKNVVLDLIIIIMTRHNQLRDCIADFCHKACLSPQIEKGSGILPKDQSRPADILEPNWSLSRPAAFDIKVINPLNLQFIQEAAQTCGHAAEMGEEAKHSRNDEACALRGWSCIPLVVEVFGGWGNEAINVLLTISKKVARIYVDL